MTTDEIYAALTSPNGPYETVLWTCKGTRREWAIVPTATRTPHTIMEGGTATTPPAALIEILKGLNQ